MNKKIAIITSGFLPVPATKGGAVENLIVNLIKENEEYKDFEFCIYSIYDEEAMKESNCYKQALFDFYTPNKLILLLDKIIFLLAKNIFKKRNSQTYRFICQRIFFFKYVSKALSNHNYDNILLENHPTQYLCLKFRNNYKKYNGKVIYHCHNEFPSTFGLKKIIETTDKFICVSKYIKRQLSSYLNLEEDKFYVLKNCVDENKFKPNANIDKNKIDSIRKKYGFKDEDFIIIFAGRIVPEKGVFELIEAIKLVENKNVKLMIVGSALNALQAKTDYQIKIEKLIENIDNKIFFTGFVSYNEMPYLYKAADVAIIPSVWNDPAPLTVIEAIMSGLPIITTNSGGIPEYVNSKNAIVLDRENNLAKNLAIEIDKLINNKELRKEMSAESTVLSSQMSVKNYYKNFKKIVK